MHVFRPGRPQNQGDVQGRSRRQSKSPHQPQVPLLFRAKSQITKSIVDPRLPLLPQEGCSRAQGEEGCCQAAENRPRLPARLAKGRGGNQRKKGECREKRLTVQED